MLGLLFQTFDLKTILRWQFFSHVNNYTCTDRAAHDYHYLEAQGVPLETTSQETMEATKACGRPLGNRITAN